jgi:hypothetical protein
VRLGFGEGRYHRGERQKHQVVRCANHPFPSPGQPNLTLNASDAQQHKSPVRIHELPQDAYGTFACGATYCIFRILVSNNGDKHQEGCPMPGFAE